MAARSYDLKLDRAEQHLIELKDALDRYVEKHPYEVRRHVEGKKKREVFRLHFTEQPDPTIGPIVGDVIYNLRSALDHLMAALVPSERRSKVYFPIYWQGVWEPPEPGEHPKRSKDRGRWASDTAKVHPDALAILKANQPPLDAWDPPESHGLIILNRIATKDRHTKLPIVAASLVAEHGECLGPDGIWRPVRTHDFSPSEGVPDGAEVFLPQGSVDVKIQGTAQVFVRIRAADKGGYKIPDTLDALLVGGRKMADLLGPFDRMNPT